LIIYILNIYISIIVYFIYVGRLSYFDDVDAGEYNKDKQQR